MFHTIWKAGRNRIHSSHQWISVCRPIMNMVTRSLTSRSGSPFTQSFPVGRLTNSTSTFVSSHYKIDEGSIVNYLERKGVDFKENPDEFIVRECMFCPKPHYNKSDNLYKLYISKKTGAFICHRCGTCGSWFDFKRKQGDLQDDKGTQPLSENQTNPVADSGKVTQVQQLAYKNMKEYIQNLHSNTTYSSVWKTLVDQTPTGRWLTEQTIHKYCIGATTRSFVSEDGKQVDEPCVVFPWITLDREGNPIVHRYKIRSITTKSHMRLEPAGGDWGFFGWHVLPKNCHSLVITEGEYDAMAVYQATGIPAISLPNGATSLPVRLLPLLENIKDIVLWMDFDRVGQDNAQRFAKKLGQGRVRIVAPPVMEESSKPVKDACDCLRQGYNLREFIDKATCIRHDQILTFSELKNDIFYDIVHPYELQGTQYLTLPIMNKTLKGHRRGELTILTGPTGSGKTTLLSQLSIDLLKQGVPTLWGSFEIANRRLGMTMLRQFSKIPITPEISHSQYEDITTCFQQLPLYYLRFFGTTRVEQILDAMEYSVYAYDVQHIILDNLQFLMGTTFSGYERFDAQEKALHEFRKFATTQNVHVTLVIHPRKEPDEQALNISSVFGTAKATQEADNVIILQNENGQKRIEIKKNRFDGDLGSAQLVFNRQRLIFEEKSSKESRAERGHYSEGQQGQQGQQGQYPEHPEHPEHLEHLEHPEQGQYKVKVEPSIGREMGKTAHDIIVG